VANNSSEQERGVVASFPTDQMFPHWHLRISGRLEGNGILAPWNASGTTIATEHHAASSQGLTAELQRLVSRNLPPVRLGPTAKSGKPQSPCLDLGPHVNIIIVVLHSLTADCKV
jgi:hypothetical protein